MRRLAGVIIAGALSFSSAAIPGGARAQESLLDGLRSQAQANDWRASLSLGRSLRRAGRSSEAENELHRAAALASASAPAPDPSDGPGVEHLVQAGAKARNARVLVVDAELARVYVDRRDFSRAVATCNRMVTMAGGAAEGHACLAGAHILWQRASQALVETSIALEKDSRCYEARLAEGRAHELELDLSRAEESLRQAIDLRPDAAEAHRELGRALVAEGKKDEGIAELRKAVSLDPMGPDDLLELATALPSGGERASLAERAARERPSFVEAWIILGSERLAAGQLKGARAAAESAARVDPPNAEARLLLARTEMVEGRIDDAVGDARQVLAKLPNNAAAKLIVADGAAKKGDLDVALEAYQAAWGLNHADPTPLVHASEACHSAGRDTSARAFGVRATQEFPDWAPGWVALGNALLAQGEKGEAGDAYRKALSAGGGDVDKDAVRKRLASIR